MNVANQKGLRAFSVTNPYENDETKPFNERIKPSVEKWLRGFYDALPAACKLAKKYKVEMPIVNAVDDILSGRLAARDALATMMGRQLKQE